MFLGEYEYKIDDKGRIPLPPRFRPSFQDGIILTAGPEKCVLCYTPSEWKKLADNLTTGSIFTSKMRKLNRAFFATAFHLTVDAQGRIALPATLRQHASIATDVIVTGQNTYLEIWDKTTWELEKQDSQAQMWQIIETLEKR